MVPPAFVFKSDEASWKSVVEPMLLTLNRVEVEKDAVDEPIAKSVSGEPSVVVEVKTESLANGDDVPIPTSPACPVTVRNGFTFAEDEAMRRRLFVCVVVAWRDSVADGVVEPRPSLPVELSKMNCPPPALPNLTVVDACRPPERRMAVEVEFTVPPKLFVVENGNA
jgi:hypothetical protein